MKTRLCSMVQGLMPAQGGFLGEDRDKTGTSGIRKTNMAPQGLVRQAVAEPCSGGTERSGFEPEVRG